MQRSGLYFLDMEGRPVKKDDTGDRQVGCDGDCYNDNGATVESVRSLSVTDHLVSFHGHACQMWTGERAD